MGAMHDVYSCVNVWQVMFCDACMFACVYVCMWACMHVCIYLCIRDGDVCVYALIRVFVYICVDARMHAFM